MQEKHEDIILPKIKDLKKEIENSILNNLNHLKEFFEYINKTILLD